MNFLTTAQQVDINRAVAENQSLLQPIKQFILDHFGQNGLYAAYLLVAALIVLLVWQLIRFSFQVILFIVLPSAISSFGLSLVLPYDFFYLLPATTALFTLGLILRTVAFNKA